MPPAPTSPTYRCLAATALVRYPSSSGEETRAKLNEAESTRKEIQEQERLDQEAADYHCEKGNEFFKKKKYQEAAAHYTEAMKSNPNDPRVRIMVITVIVLHITTGLPETIT